MGLENSSGDKMKIEINNKYYNVEDSRGDEKLIDFLRNDLKLRQCKKRVRNRRMRNLYGYCKR